MIRVLHIDDDQTEFLLLSLNVKKIDNDLDFQHVDQASKALDLLDEENFDCIVCDYQMPGMDGMEFLFALKERNKEIPFIFRTGQGSEKLAVEALRAGADDYFTKEEVFAHYERLCNSISSHVKANKEKFEKRKAKNDLLESEEKFRFTIEQFPSVFEMYDIKGTQVHVNKAYEDLWGFSKETTLGTFNLFKSQEVVDSGLIEYINEAYKGNIVKVPEYSFDSRNEVGVGRVRWLSTTIYPIKQKGEIVNVIITHEDISDRKRAETALKESEQRFKALFDNAPLSYQSLDEDGNFLAVNQTFLEMLGYTEEEILGHSYSDILTHEYKDTFRKNFPILKSRGRVNNVPFELVKKDGSVIQIELEGRVSYDDKGDFVQTHCVFIDISKRKKAEELVDEKEKKYKALFENSSSAIFICDPETYLISEANQATSELYGYSKDELIGMSCLEFSADIEHSKRAIDEVNTSGSIKVGLKWHKKKNGSIFPVEISGSKVVVNGKKLLFAVSNDISKSVQADSELKKQKYYLEKAQEIGKIGTWELDLESNVLIWTDENCRIFGVPEGTVSDYEIFINKVHPADREYVDAEWKAALGGKPYDIEHRLLIDGKTKWVREKAELEYDQEGKPVRATGLTQDITYRK